ncbi:unnamed protein product [Spirodela intermedia]|uniref:Uncharacterized protein n=1 Tax=Spirodela intermedia TaxID=51605 RepID=A0A7I8KQM2_SPIIN|nr:unnamed protein product [Spirodela intermedia]
MEEERDGRLPIGGDGGGGGGRAAPPPREEWSLEDHPRGWEVVVMDRRALLYEDDFSVFPPSDHEGLLVEQAPMAAAEGRSAVVASPLSSPPSLSSAGNGGESRWPVRCHLQRKGERWPLVELARRAFDSGIERLWFKLPRPSVGAVPAGVKGGTIWSFTAVAGLTALLLYSNHRYRREKLRLLLLIKEKDQTITWLSQHIAQMNELMAARLIVPVARSA